MNRLLGRAGGLGVALLIGLAAPADARPLTLGFYDQRFSASPMGELMIAEAATTGGAQIVRIQADWRSISAVRPASPADPGDPAYDWSGVDAAVRAARGAGLDVLLGVSRAPRWAEGPDRPATAPSGSWRPDAAAFGAFARAAATRFSGTYAPPGTATPLPRVRFWQAWNEPNLDLYLSPQWVRAGDGYRSEGPRLYRALQNEFYAGVKAVDARNRVVSAGTAPYGDRAPGGRRTMPVRFLRELFCLSRSLRRLRCEGATRFDILAHHPYGTRGPFSHSLNPDDAAVPDIRKLTRVVRGAVRAGRLLPRRAKRVWVTEISWDSSPPDPDGVPAARHARWLAQSLDVLSRQGVDTVFWYRLRDEPPVPSFATTYQSGILLADGREKPAARAFRLPLSLTPRARRVRLWVRAPRAGRLRVVVRDAGRVRTMLRLRVRRGQVVVRMLPRRPGRWQADAGRARSLPWTVRPSSGN